MKKFFNKIKQYFINNSKYKDMSKIGLTGTIKVWLFKEDGQVLHYIKENMIVNVGLNTICHAISSAASPIIAKTQIGSGDTPTLLTTTALQTPLASVSTSFTLNTQQNTVTFISDFDKGVGTGNIKEYGLLDSSNGLFDRIVTTETLVKGPQDILRTEIEIKVENKVV